MGVFVGGIALWLLEQLSPKSPQRLQKFPMFNRDAVDTIWWSAALLVFVFAEVNGIGDDGNKAFRLKRTPTLILKEC